MTADILEFSGLTSLDISPDKVLRAAVGTLDQAIVVGVEPDGEIYIAGSMGSAAEAYVLLERAKVRLLAMMDEDVMHRS